MLIIAATPIGNLEDISARLTRTLAEADYLFAEDTRQTRKLLSHLQIDRKLTAFHEHSEEVTRQYIGDLLKGGNTVAYVSDGGMPAISDPGYELVSLALELDIEVDVIPGPCAVINALVLSGLPSHAFAFLGFFPTKPERRREVLDKLEAMALTTVFYEAPSRIQHTLTYLTEHIPETPVALCREMTKRHQEVLRGTPAQVLEKLEQVRGEMALVIAPVAHRATEKTLEERYQELLAEGNSPSRCAKLLAGEFRMSKRDVYKRLHDTE